MSLLCAQAHAQTEVLSDYCDYPTGHQCNPDFADANSHISLSVGRNEQGKMAVSITSRGHDKVIDLLWVNTSYGIGQYGSTINDACSECSTTATVTFDIGDRTDDFVINQLHWSYVGFDGEWAADCGLAEPYNASCDIESNDHAAPVISKAEVVDGSIAYDKAQLHLVADDETSGPCLKFSLTDEANGIVNRVVTVDVENRLGTIDGLNPVTEYNFSVTTRDASGNTSAPQSLRLTTASRASECMASFGHFTCGADDCKKISVTIKYDAAQGVTYTMKTLEDSELDYAEVCIVNYGAHPMTISDDKRSATYTHGDAPENEVFQSFFLYSTTEMPGNEQTADGWADYGRMMYYKVCDCNSTALAAPIENRANVEAFPTVASTALTLQSDEPMGEYRLFAISGGEVMRGNMGGTSLATVNVTSLAKGSYFIHVQTASGSGIVRFMKK